MHKRAVLLLAVLQTTSLLVMAWWPTSSADPTVEQLLQKTDDLMRGESSEGKTTMRVKTARWDRTMTMQSWSEGTQKTLIQILSPPKERGTATLKVENNIWNYLPKVDRTIKVPGSMMSGSWMGSHFSNDDLVKNSRFSDDYTCEFLEKPTGRSEGHYVIKCTPKPEAPVVWGKVVIKIRAIDELVDEITFYDEDDKLVRTFTYDDIGDIGGRTLPRRMTVVPADKPDEFTQITYDELTFNVKHPERLFTLQALRK
jgi:hypothetical protein